MGDEGRQEVIRAVVVALIGLAGVGIQYALTSQSFRIEVRAKLAAVDAWFDRWRQDHSLADAMRAEAEAAEVIAAAEAILTTETEGASDAG